MQTSSVTIPQFTTGAFHCFGLRARVDLDNMIQVDTGIYASPEPPFYIDEWWEEQLGKLQVKMINGCSLFLLAQTSDDAIEPFLAGHLQNY